VGTAPDCDRIVLSAGNLLAWITTDRGRLIAKWSVVPELFPRLADTAALTAWLHARGTPVAAPLPATDGRLRVEVDGVSIGVREGIRITAVLDFEDATYGSRVADLARAAVLLGTRYHDWTPTSPAVRDAFVAAYRERLPLTGMERDEVRRGIAEVLEHFRH
jgi:Ser/Thr protein kinase RdoA (MazF antagonist)